MTGGTGNDTRRRRLLVVDEYPQTRAIAPRVFNYYGYETKVAATPDEAVSAAQTFEPDVVLLEWYLLKSAASGLAARLRECASAQGRDLVIIAVSVIDEPHEFRDTEGIDEYFVKPIAAADLDRAISLLLARRPPRS